MQNIELIFPIWLVCPSAFQRLRVSDFLCSLSLGLLPSCCFIVTTIGNPFDLAFMRCKNIFRFALQWKDGKENEAQWRALMKETGRKYGDESVECFWNSIARHWTAFVRYIIYYRRNDEQFLDFFSWPNKNISLAKTTPRCNCDYFRCNKSQKMLSKVVKTSFSSFGTFWASLISSFFLSCFTIDVYIRQTYCEFETANFLVQS